MTWSFTDGVIRVEKVGASWVYVTWEDQSKAKFLTLIRKIKKLEGVIRKQGAKGWIANAAMDNHHIHGVIHRLGAEEYERKDGYIYFKREVTSNGVSDKII